MADAGFGVEFEVDEDVVRLLGDVEVEVEARRTAFLLSLS
jgi:hypothetical protein